MTWVLHQQGSSKVGEINAWIGRLNRRIASSNKCVCGSKPTLAELPKRPVFGIPMKRDLKRLQMSSSPRKLLRSTFLGWILNFRSGDMGLVVSTGLEVTRQGAITWEKRLWKDRITGEKKRRKKIMKFYKTIITCCLKSTGQ